MSQTSVLRSSRLIPLAVALVAAPAAVFSYAMIGEVIGQDLFQVAHLATVMIVVTVGVFVFCLPARAAMGWVFACRRPDDVAAGDRVVGENNPRVCFGTLGALVCLGLFAALFARLWYLQVMNADPPTSQVADRSTRCSPSTPPPVGGSSTATATCWSTTRPPRSWPSTGRRSPR